MMHKYENLNHSIVRVCRVVESHERQANRVTSKKRQQVLLIIGMFQHARLLTASAIKDKTLRLRLDRVYEKLPLHLFFSKKRH